MKKFRFTLAVVEKVRRYKQDEAKHALSAAWHHWRSQKTALMHLTEQQTQWDQQLHHQLVAGISAGQAQSYWAYVRVLTQQKQRQAQAVQAAAQEVQQRQQDLERAWRACQVMEKLRQRRFAQYLAAVGKEEQKVIDEVALRQFVRHRQRFDTGEKETRA